MWSVLFPGQGSQQPGMGRFLFDEFKVARTTFEEASDALSVDFKKLCFDGSEADLALTENTQPCLVLVSTATDRVLKSEFGFAPAVAAGHSVGEYAAMVSAGAMGFADAMRAVRIRGQAMQSAVPVGQGGMTAVMGLTPEQVSELCAWAERGSGTGLVQPANLNAPGQIVISGSQAALTWLATNFKAETFPSWPRVKLIPLKVSAPFHCAMMEPAEQRMMDVLQGTQFTSPKFPIVQNVTATAVTEPEALRANLVAQISRPVRWIECVERICALGASQAVEAGCGRVIAGLVKKIVGDRLSVQNVSSLEDLKTVETVLKG